MKVKSIRVRNFRSVLDEQISLSTLTALVGRNGSGKSTFLNAVNYFYATSDRIVLEDFYNCDSSQDISITLTFTDLSEEAAQLFDKYVTDGNLTIEKIYQWNDGSPKATYHGSLLRFSRFSAVREGFEVRDRGRTARAALDALRGAGEIPDLPQWSTIDGVKESLAVWEEQHPDLCVRMRDEGQFFGFRQVGEGYIGRFTRCLFIPAVRDAPADATEARGSIFSALIDLVVRNVLASKPEVVNLQNRLQSEYENLLSPENLPELYNLASGLTATLQTFVPNAEVLLSWLPTEELSIPMPSAMMRLIEDGFPAPVDKCGHGLQRAFIVTMLQHLTMVSATRSEQDTSDTEEAESNEPNLPDLLLMIEEPELYQHPNRQRHFAQILMDLARGRTPGVAESTQVLYSTHSPHFVGIDRIDYLRLLRKHQYDPSFPLVTEVVQTNLEAVANRIWEAQGGHGEPFTAQSLRPRLVSIMTPWMSEGFFADAVVLVEGEDDRAAILGMARVMGYNFEAMGISVIPCGGKSNIDRPTAIFQQLGIPTYSIWDGDQGKEDADPALNRALMRLFGYEPVDWPAIITDSFACFQSDLETTLGNEIGTDAFDRLLRDCQLTYGIPKKKHAIKNPHVLSEIIRLAEIEGIDCPSLREILERVIALV
jgi:putative ATP-dependent endonuclease of OLD family